MVTLFTHNNNKILEIKIYLSSNPKWTMDWHEGKIYYNENMLLVWKELRVSRII